MMPLEFMMLVGRKGQGESFVDILKRKEVNPQGVFRGRPTR
jgi:hypothetical protein